MAEATKGLIAMLLCCSFWGLSSIYYKLLSEVPPLEVLAHRTIWSLVMFAIILGLRGRLWQLGACLGSRRTILLTLCAAVMISTNWFGFIFSVQTGHAMQASLGYYIFPLVAVLMGLIFFGDRLRPLQWLAVGFACAGVITLSSGQGVFPGISLLLAFSFGFYGVVKRGVKATPMASVMAEVLLLSPIALIWLVGVHHFGWTGPTGRTGGYFGHDLKLSALLILSGPLTGIPLILFSYASQRLSLPTLGIIQYSNPTIQFLVATFLFGEPFTIWHALAFPLIWTGLAVYSWDGWRRAHNPLGRI